MIFELISLIIILILGFVVGFMFGYAVSKIIIDLKGDRDD